MNNYFNSIFIEGKWPLFYSYLGVILIIVLLTIILVYREVKRTVK